jgi:uncharacterized protein YxjI
MAFKPAPGERYTVRRKILSILGAKFHVYDEQGQIVAFCQQKAFKLREDIRLYTDETMTETLLLLRARNITDFGVTLDVILPDGASLGSMRRKGMRSTFVRDQWQIFDPSDRRVATMTELGGFAPFARRFVNNASAFMPQTFAMVRDSDGAEIARYRQHFHPMVYRLGIAPIREDEHLGDLLILAAGCLIAAIEGRQS